MKKARVLVAALAGVAAAAYANTGTVTAELSGGTFNVSFANHAHETNSLWVVYDGFDYGPGTNGWGHVERLGTVYPETDTWTYAVPAGWGETYDLRRTTCADDITTFDLRPSHVALPHVGSVRRTS